MENKTWYHDKSKWDTDRNKLNVSDDDETFSKDPSGKLIAHWNKTLNVGWILKKGEN